MKNNNCNEPKAGSLKRRTMTRRAFLGLGGVAALSFWGFGTAWGGVGGGAWGAYGGVAYPTSHFGFDAGWSHSYDKCVWLAASCNCTVGRMTELYLAVQVDAYVACGGVWHPTWSPDLPDTPTYAYIRNEGGAWLTSAFWNIDTTYDHDYFVYMTGASLRVERERGDWRCWCGADIKGLGGSAPGTHSVAEAPQIIPHHVLVDNQGWHGRIATLRPRSAEHLCLDVTAGSCDHGANVAAWPPSNTTNQNWIVLTSNYGRTSLVPVHTGDQPRFLDSWGGTWDDGANVVSAVGNGTRAQSLYLHNLGASDHLLVFECSGCALDLYNGGQAGGTQVHQWNCYNNWKNANQHWILEEVYLRLREGCTLELHGLPEPGNSLTVSRPHDRCFPYDYPGTAGMRYRYTWYSGNAPGVRTTVVQAASETASYAPVDADIDLFITCVVTAFSRYGDVRYGGEVVSSSVQVRSPLVRVRFFVDQETQPCFTDEVRRGEAYAVSALANQAATKPDCAGLEGWYRDSAYTALFNDGEQLEDHLDLFARNKVVLTYAMSERSCLHERDRQYYVDRDLSVLMEEAEQMLPESETHYYGNRVTFARGRSVWFSHKGRTREASCAPGVYADSAATSTPARAARVVRNTTVYLAWRTPSYDGISLS